MLVTKSKILDGELEFFGGHIKLYSVDYLWEHESYAEQG